jgi:hypothetical protein
MSFPENLNLVGKVYGQECKEKAMCTSSILKPFRKLTRGLLGISKPKAPVEPPEAAEARQMKKEQIAEQEQRQADERQERLKTQIRAKKRRGKGKRSLITGQGGGIGYFDETL